MSHIQNFVVFNLSLSNEKRLQLTILGFLSNYSFKIVITILKPDMSKFVSATKMVNF